MRKANKASRPYSKTDPVVRAEFLNRIADRLSDKSSELIKTAVTETHLSEARLKTELQRTAFQLKDYGNAARSIMGIIKESAAPNCTRIIKKNHSIGPTVVFGASNFPFAYSTAGGDTASALAAGCPVIVKGHPAHIKTSRAIALLISECVTEFKLPEGTFQHAEGFEAGEALVKHPFTCAVAFTGSLKGGRQLFYWGQQRQIPIPVFAEMGSINPVYILPGFKEDPGKMASMLADSILNSSGQFCTKPGLIIATDDDFLQSFKQALAGKINEAQPAMLLHSGIFSEFSEKRERAKSMHGVSLLAGSDAEAAHGKGNPLLVECDASAFIMDQALHEEVFGPFSIIVKCKNVMEMETVAGSLEGQLTSTVWGTKESLNHHESLIDEIRNKCGRMIFNGVPTGVTVCDAMHHGGPYPATTDSRFTSVGSDAILRFCRPVSYQNWPDI